ncbi:hypothetical protein ASD82_15110 [Rhodanobacter sp. Root179]|nr:hypothetical protein ASD82_15110 [Rhodanobacter sp. Root179]
MNAGGHRYFIETCASNPEVVGFRTCRTEACEKDHCRHVPQLLTVRAALALCALPCRHARDCYGYLQVVFKDELTPEQLTQIEADI